MIKAIKDNYTTLYNLTPENKEEIMKDLTLENPKYKQAVKFSKYKVSRIPKNLYFYIETKEGDLIVPVGYKIPFEHKIVDMRKEVTVKYPPIQVSLRDTQKEAYLSYLEDTDNGVISMPTGKGKTILGIYLAYALKQKTLIIVHKDDLLIGWKKDIKMCFNNEIKPGIIKASKRQIGDQITIAMIQTLSNYTDSELRKLKNEFGLIIVDETHHAGSKSYDVLSYLSAPYKIGLSATPKRTDGLQPVIHLHLGGFAYIYKIQENDDDILDVDITYRDIPIPYTPNVIKVGNTYKYVEKGGVPITNIDYSKRPNIHQKVIEDYLISNNYYESVYVKDIIEEFNKGHSILVTLSFKEHCKYVYDTLIAYGIPKDKIQLYYGDSKEKKDTIIKRAENNRQFITIATYSVVTEGTNVKQWEVLFMLSSLSNGNATEQVVGRIRRTTSKPKLSRAKLYDYNFSEAYALKSHIYKRKARYRKMNLGSASSKPFSIGYKK